MSRCQLQRLLPGPEPCVSKSGKESALIEKVKPRSNTQDISQALAIIRPIGHHKLDISVHGKFNLFSSVTYVCSDSDPTQWAWLSSERFRVLRLGIRPILPVDPIRLRDGKYGLNSWSFLEGLDTVAKHVDFIDTSELCTFFSRQCATLARKFGKRLITTVIETIPNHITSLVPPYSWNTKYVAKNTDLFIVPTQRSREFLISLEIENEKIKQVRFGVDLEQFHPTRRRLGDGPVRILFASPLTRKRGLPHLLAAFKHLCQQTLNVEMLVCGTGPLEGLLLDYCRRYPIRYLGAVHWKEMPEVYRQCDIFCLPGNDVYKYGLKLTEDGQYSSVVLEAMACGLPIVTTDSGTYPELVGPRNFIVPQGSIESLVNALSSLISDPDKRKHLGNYNAERAKELFDGRRQCEEYAAALMETLS